MTWLLAALAVVALLAMLWGVLSRADRPAAVAPADPSAGSLPAFQAPVNAPRMPLGLPEGGVVPYPSTGAPARAEEAPAQFQPFAGARLTWDQLCAYNVLGAQVL